MQATTLVVELMILKSNIIKITTVATGLLSVKSIKQYQSIAPDLVAPILEVKSKLTLPIH
jgi:hypothetical protein